MLATAFWKYSRALASRPLSRCHNPIVYPIVASDRFTALPIIAGINKFFHFLTDWPKYPAPIIPRTLGISRAGLMHIVGGIEMLAGVIVAVWRRFGAYVVTAWLWGIIINLLIGQGYYDVALRDFGLSLGALALARMSLNFEAISDPGRRKMTAGVPRSMACETRPWPSSPAPVWP